jgi:hypothetical protein
MRRFWLEWAKARADLRGTDTRPWVGAGRGWRRRVEAVKEGWKSREEQTNGV